MKAYLSEVRLEVQPIHIGQTDIDDNASWPVSEVRGQKITRRLVGPRLKADRVEEFLQRAADRCIVVDNMHDRSIARLQRHGAALSRENTPSSRSIRPAKRIVNMRQVVNGVFGAQQSVRTDRIWLLSRDFDQLDEPRSCNQPLFAIIRSAIVSDSVGSLG
jgi:hypothetical protein